MIALGIILTIFGFVFRIFHYLIEESNKMTKNCIIMILIGFNLIMYDVTSPTIDIVQESYITTKFNDIVYNKPVKITEINTKPTRFLAVSGLNTKYEVIVD